MLPPAHVRFMQFEPTTRCNMTCGYCVGRHLPQLDASLQTFVAALDAFPRLEHVELQGEGEPLLHPRLFEMLEAARERGLAVSLITNGSLLSEANVELLLEARLRKVLISIDSADAATFQRLRGGHLHKVIDGTRRLIDQRDARRLLRPAVGVMVTVLKSTQVGFADIAALYQQLRLDGGLGWQVLSSMPSYLACYPPELHAELVATQTHLPVLAQAAGDPRCAPARPASWLRGFHEELFAGYQPRARCCPWLEQGVFVNVEGLASACCMVKDVTQGFGPLAESLPQASRREAMRTELRHNRIPLACAGCTVAGDACG